MKRFYYVLIIVLVCACSLTACVDIYAGKRPTDYSGTLWISDNPDMYFRVDRSETSYGYLKEDLANIGEMQCNGKTTEIKLGFEFSDKVSILSTDLLAQNLDDMSKAEILFGSCIFSKTRLIIKVNRVNTEYFDPSLKEIIFIRQDVDSNS